MAHHKRRKRRKGGVKGCCAMCAMATRHGGLRNKRIRTRQERRADDGADKVLTQKTLGR